MKKYNLPTAQSIFDAVILANGKFPTHKTAIQILKNAQYIVCCDGAINQLERTNIVPQAIVGDCDSLSNECKLKYSNIIHPDSDQETNDLTKSVNYCIKKGLKKIAIVGACGKREDHTLANISLLTEYMDIADEIELITDYGVFTPVKQFSVFESYPKQQVSLFAIENQPVTTHDLKFPVENRIFTNWWQGTLNESNKREFKIDTSGKIIVYRAF